MKNAPLGERPGVEPGNPPLLLLFAIYETNMCVRCMLCIVNEKAVCLSLCVCMRIGTHTRGFDK